jgi:WD40 repeat protein
MSKFGDAVSGICLRTYSDHSDYVTSLSVADDDHTFLATSADLTVKIWVITSVPNYAPGVWCLFA